MANVLLGVTGSVAAIRTPALFAALRERGHVVKVVATNASLYFFDPVELDPRSPVRNPEVVVLDQDEWPGSGRGERYRRDDPVLHIELRKWAELMVIAPPGRQHPGETCEWPVGQLPDLRLACLGSRKAGRACARNEHAHVGSSADRTASAPVGSRRRR